MRPRQALADAISHPGCALNPPPQHILSHASDVRTVATARLVSKSWHSAVEGAPALIECSLAGNDAAATRAKLRGMRTIVPCLRGLRLSVSPGATAGLLAEALREAAAFHLLE